MEQELKGVVVAAANAAVVERRADIRIQGSELWIARVPE
jgi:hypothetical protein